MNVNATQTREVEPLSVRADIVPGSLNEEERTVDVVWTTGARVKRSDWFDGAFWEELSTEPKHVRMGRLQSGRAPVLLQHNSWNPDAHQGVVVSASIKPGQGAAKLRFLKNDVDADKTWNKIRQGVLTSVSVGYAVHKVEETKGGDGQLPVRKAVDWEPYEISPVSMPADPSAHMRSETRRTNPCEFISITRGEAPQKEKQHMTTENIGSGADESVRAERERASAIRMAVRKAKLGDDLADKLVDDGTTLDAARAVIIDSIAERSAQGGPSEAPSGVPGSNRDLRDARGGNAPDIVRDMTDGLALRLGWRGADGSGKVSATAQQFSRLTLVDLARECLYARGESTRFMPPGKILDRAFGAASTGDFPVLLQGAGERLLMQGFESAQGGIKQIASKKSARDFRTKKLVQLSEAPELKKVDESGEVTWGAFSHDWRDSYKLETFGRIFSLTRTAIINDDLGAMDIALAFGRTAAEFEHKALASLLTSNSGLGPTMPDGKALFHVDHGNLASSGSAISIASLGAGAAAMRTQQSFDKLMVLNVIPRFLLVPAALEVVARQHVAQINANVAQNVNPFGGQLEVVVDPRLDAVSKTAWYLAAAPGSGPGLEYSYLDGQEGPTITTVEDFETLGVSWRVVLDWGCGILSHEGLYKNPGA